MNYAVISTGGKQYKISPGLLLDVEQIPGQQGEKIRLEQVLAARTEDGFKVGHPFLQGASVAAEIIEHLKGPKVVNFKYKRRKGYHRKVGHRQNLTRLRIVEITFNGSH